VAEDGEHGLDVALAERRGDLLGGPVLALLPPELGEDPALQRENGGRGLLPGLDPGLVIRVDADERSRWSASSRSDVFERSTRSESDGTWRERA